MSKAVPRSKERGARRLLGVGLALAVPATAVVPVAAEEHGKSKAEASREFTLGAVQKELRQGLSQADVAERLGSPNLVTRDAAGREAWVYDRVSTEVEAASQGIGIAGGGTGAGSTFAGILGLSAGKRSERVRSSQKTLTVVVRFSAEGSVESFTWHSSRF